VAARLLGRPLVGSDVRSLALGYTPAPTGSAEQRWFHGEAQAVAATLGTAPLLGPQATSAAITAQAGQALKYVHLSCHGLFNPGDPMASAVLLADGPFSVRQWSALALDADLVTLSACQTGLLGSLGGDEWSGFSQGLLLAGARSSVLGLWSVDALTTAVLMNDFYRRLEAGQPKAAALRAACLALRDGKLMPVSPHLDVSDPYYWAPFALYGQWQ
jgi:CHAT domain-containing protein